VSEFNKKTERINTNTYIEQSMTRRILVVFFGLIETLLGFRFIFKIAGANPANTLINLLYSTTDFMVKIFASIFTPGTSDGLETVSIIEPGTIIAMIVVALDRTCYFKVDGSKHECSKEHSRIFSRSQDH